MALRAIDVASLDTPTRVAPRTTIASVTIATVTDLPPAPRMVALAAARRERRKWFVLGGLLFATPFLACIGVLEVVR